MKLSARTVLITGGSSGIGLAFAGRFLDLGATVIVTGRRKEVLDQARKRHPKLHAIQSDVSDPVQVAALAARLKADFPRLDVLVNNAGVMLAKNLADPTHNLFDLTQEIEINVSGVVRTTASLVDLIIANRGTIINVSSALAFVPAPAMPIYCATKAAVHSYTQSLRYQLKDAGVDVIELMPPAVETDLGAEFSASGFDMITTETLLDQTFRALKRGEVEIRPGQARLLALMRRLAPDVIGKRLWDASRILVPPLSSAN